MKSITIFTVLLFNFLSIKTVIAQSPGNISTSFWLKADTGVEEASSNSAEDGDAVSSWLDQAGSNNATQSTTANRPIFRDNTTDYLNYNPVVQFTNQSGSSADGYLNFNNPETGEFDLYQVVSTVQSTSNTIFWNQPLFYGGDQNELNRTDVCVTLDNTGVLHIGGGVNGDYDITGTTNISNSSQSRLIQVSRTINAISDTDFNWRVDGGENGSQNITRPNNGTDMSANIRIGLHDNGETEAYDGRVAETIVFSAPLSSSNRARVETYLAVKYGVTMSSNYVHTGGTTIYDVSTYNNNIIGIGRDDNEALLQKQSHSFDDTTRIYVGTLNSSNAGNTAVASDFGNDQAYIMLGENQGRMCSSSSSDAEQPAGIFSRLEREWKVTNTNYTGTFSCDFTINTCAAPDMVNTGDLRLLIDDDGDFSNATVYAASGGGLSFSYNNNSVITVSGISNTHIAAGATRYMTIASVDFATPLPIELSHFNATAINKQVKLDWQTVLEINNDYFTVERSADGFTWEPIQKVNGAGNSQQTQNYSTWDLEPLTGLSYYRLKQTDFDGSFTYSSIRTVKIDHQDSFIIYPNPAKDFLIIESAQIADMKVKIINSIGQEIDLSHTLEVNRAVYNTQKLADGVYFVIVSVEGEIISKPIVVQ